MGAEERQEMYTTRETSLISLNLFMLKILFVLMPFLSYLSLQIQFFTLAKEIISTIIIFFSLIIISMRNNNFINNKIIFLFIFILYGVSHIFISNLPLSVGMDKFRLVYLYPIMFLFLYSALISLRKFDAEFLNYNRIFIVQSGIIIFIGIIQFIFEDRFIILFYPNFMERLHIDLLGESGIRLISLLINPIILGLFLNISLIVILCNKKIHIIVRLLISIAIIFLILFTFSRIAYIITVFILIYFFIINNISLKKTIIKIIILAAILPLMAIMELDSNNLIGKRLSQINSTALSENVRLENWNEYLSAALQNGNYFLILWGSGLGSSNSDSTKQSEIIKKVENSYITFFGELGIIGILFFVILIARYLYNVIIIYRFGEKDYAIVFLGVLIILTIGALGNDVFHNNPFSFYFWFGLFATELINSGNRTRVHKSE